MTLCIVPHLCGALGVFGAPAAGSRLENVSLENPPARHPAVFHDAPVKVLFGVLVAFFAAEKHDRPI